MQETTQSKVRPTAPSFTILEPVWAALATALVVWGLLAVALAQAGLYRAWALLLLAAIALAMGWLFYRALKVPTLRPVRREALFVALLMGIGLLIYCWPAEHLIQLGDSSIYPNTAANLVRTGGLVYHYDPLDGLTAEQKELFYVPSDRQLANQEIESYEGLLYGAYYVMDPTSNRIVSSRPPLAIVWMGLFGTIFGERGMLYVTPLFGVASLVAVYFLGKRIFEPAAGALAAVWLLVSFPQLHFSRAPYAEVVGQFFVLTFLYALVAYWQTRRLVLILLGVAALTAAFAARIDSILAAPTLLLFFLLLAYHRDWRGLGAIFASTVAGLAFSLWTVNQPYVGATAELLLGGQLRFLQGLAPYAIPLGLGVSLGLGLALILAPRVSLPRLQRVLLWGLCLLVVVGIGYDLHIRPMIPEYVLVGGELLPAYNEELMAEAAHYTSPLVFWLAACGVVLAAWRSRNRLESMLLLAFVASFASIFFWKYTTARVYPVALRRLVPEVLPGLMLFGAYAIHWLARRPRLRWAGIGLAGLTATLLLAVSGPYWFHPEAQGTLDWLESLEERIPSGAVVLFEPQQEDAVVGWFATPLWSLSQQDALLINPGELNGELLDETVCYWLRQGKEVYLLAQHAPSSWWPGTFEGQPQSELSWESSIIGQSLRFPPFLWRFAFQFSIYRWDGASCPPG